MQLAEYLKYELAASPPTLFERLSMQESNILKLISIPKKLEPYESTLASDPILAIDYGFPLYRVVWMRLENLQQGVSNTLTTMVKMIQ